MNALDRRWLVACLCGGATVWLVLMVVLSVRQPTVWGDPRQIMLAAIGMGFWSIPVTMFLIGIPLRLGMRRIERRHETIWLVVAFLTLLAMFVTQFLADPRDMK